MPALFEAYVTNLGKYNEGELVGEYLKFPTTPEEVQALLKRIGVGGVRYEEIFITDFNALLQPEYRKQEGEALLTPSMRIFALTRLGITSNQQIAKVLNYSYNTILNYRVRLRGMALNPDTFEQDVMKIGM